MTDAEWLVSTNLPAMLDALGERLSVRKARLFVCACCRRLEAVSAHGDTAAIVQIGERAADGAVPPRELSYQEVEADKRLTNSGCPYRERGLLCRCLQRIAGRPGARATAHHSGIHALSILKAQRQRESPGQIYPETVAWQWDLSPVYAGCPEVVCGVLREVFGDSLSAPKLPTRWPASIKGLTEAHYGGEDCHTVLHDALVDAEMPELAKHFERPFHPRGCWVVDAILKKR